MSLRLPSGLTIEPNVKLAPLTSWKVGGAAEYLVLPTTVDELKEALKWAHQQRFETTILGGGTNVLISDSGIRGLTIALPKLVGAKVEEHETPNGRVLNLECLAGTSKSELLKIFLKHRLEAALFLAGIPGDVSGGVVMNAGVGEMFKPREFVEITDWVEVLRWDEQSQDFAVVRLAAQDLKWSYRHCQGWQPGVICRVGLSWPLRPVEDIVARVKQANHIRLSKQPLDLPSCGSVFVNPPGYKSGQLIESAGLKGYTVGGAKISEKHANFLVNFNNASAQDVHAVIEHVKKTVRSLHGVELRTEVVYLGCW